VNFQVIGPWSMPERMRGLPSQAGDRGRGVLVGILILAAFLAWRNIRLRRGDTRGAARLATFAWLLSMLIWLCGASHIPTAYEFSIFIGAISQALFIAGSLWILYVALEPYVRRRLPQIMITWSRLLGCGVRDPLVGGHVLIGVAFGVGFALLWSVYHVLVEQSGAFSTAPALTLDSMLDARRMTSVLAGGLEFSIVLSLLLLFLLFLLRLLFRRLWLAAAALIVVPLLLIIFIAPASDPSNQGLLQFVFTGLMEVTMVFVLIRFGVLPMMAGFFVSRILVPFPLTADLTTWYASSSLFAIASVLALTAYAGYTALAGRPLFQAGFLERD